MKNYIQQEILIITGTTFSKRGCCEKKTAKQKNFTEKEQLEEACWNGLLQEMIPEIYYHAKENKELFLWNVKKRNSFIELEMGEIPDERDDLYSIDPYSFTQFQLLS